MALLRSKFHNLDVALPSNRTPALIAIKPLDATHF